MKKITILCVALALSFMVVPALALTNIVENWDFSTGPFTDWKNGTIAGHVAFSFGTYPFNNAYTPYTTTEAVVYQICDASSGGGWIPGGTAESYNFSFMYLRPQSTNIAEYGIWYSTNATAPAFGGPDNPGSGWTLISQSTALAVTGYGNYTTFSASGTLAGIQPQWFAVAFEGSTDPTYTSYASFTRVDLTTQCVSSVPMPPSALLMGSGLMGLLGWRRFRKG